MKNILLFILSVFLFTVTSAQTADYLQKKEFQTEKKKIYDNIDAAKKPVSDIRKLVTHQNLQIDSLNNVVKAFAAQNANYADSVNKMSARVNFLNDEVKVNHERAWLRFGNVFMMIGILLLL